MNIRRGAAKAAPEACVPERWPGRVIVILLLASGLTAQPATAAADGPLDLRAALELARRESPVLEAARAKVAEARGELTGAEVLLPENPEAEIGLGPRWLNDPQTGQQLGVEASLTQKFEIAGQRGHRMDRASAEIAAAAAEAARAVRDLDLTVATTFYQALASKERVRIAEDHERLARELLQIAQARADQGAASPVDLNTARVRLAEATRRLLRARTDEKTSRVRLAPLLGLDPASPPEVAGTLSQVSRAVMPTAAAVDAHPEVVAAGSRAEAARATADLAGAAAWPDVRLGARYFTEEASRTLLGTISIPIPIFQRNQGERERSTAAVARAAAEERAARSRAGAEVQEAAIASTEAKHVLDLYDQDVLKALEENVGLLLRMMDAGKVSAADVILIERELLDGRLGYVEARVEFAVATARVRTAAGLPILDGAAGGGR